MPGVDKPRASEIASFGPFRLAATERLLLRDEKPVHVRGRAMDILLLLVERAGQVVSKRDLIERAWPGVVVEDANLRVQLASLRRILGEGEDGPRYIANVPGRGYCFVAPIRRLQLAGRASPTAVQASPVPVRKLPPLLNRMVGREETVATLSLLLKSRRFVSIVGSGGMGKTTVAVAVAHALLEDFGDGICFVDLAALSEPGLVASAVCSALGCYAQAQNPLPGLVAFLAEKRILLVLDNCEHLIEAVASLAERLFNEAPLLHLLTTSREALRVEGEHVHLLTPLDGLGDGDDLTAAEALASPAVQLFMERAAASGHRL